MVDFIFLIYDFAKKTKLFLSFLKKKNKSCLFLFLVF